MPKVYGYARVSSLDQVDNTSIGTQTEEIMRSYESKWKIAGYEFGKIFTDKAVSGGKSLTERPGGHDLDIAVERGDVILFPKFDRGFRSLRDMLATLEVWQSRGVCPVFLDLGMDLTTPMGKMVLGVVGSVAQFVRESIKERCMAGRRAAEEKARKAGKSLYCTRLFGTVKKGQRRDKYLQIWPEEYEMGLRFLYWKKKGFTLRDIWLHLLTNRVFRPEQPGKKKGKPRVWKIASIYIGLRSTARVQRLVRKGVIKIPKGYDYREIYDGYSNGTEPGSDRDPERLPDDDAGRGDDACLPDPGAEEADEVLQG